MPEVEVTKQKQPARFEDFFAPVLSPGRFFGRRPLDLWHALSDEMDRAFSGFSSQSKEELWTPVIDVRKCNGDLVVTAELPGLKKDEIKVELTDNALVIQGERKTEHREDHDGYHRTERSYGRFYRAVPLPEEAKTDQIKAELADGVLKNSIPAPETRKLPKQVPVETPEQPKAAAA